MARPTDLTRRGFLTSTGAAGLALALPRPVAAEERRWRIERPFGSAENLASSEIYWRRVANLYSQRAGIVNLEHGYWGIMSDPVASEYGSNVERVNRDGSYFARRDLGAELEAARQRVAESLGVEASELAFTRGATEALQNLIGGYRRLRPGDSVLYADLDYDSMQWAMNWLEERRGVRVVRLAIPEPATKEKVIAAYARALEENPGIKMLLLTHLSNRTGLVVPVREIAELARARGADVILDAAHSWGQIEFRLAELGVDFVGLNLHKWIGAPLGVGLLYIRKERLADIDRAMADQSFPIDDIRSRVHSGTVNFAAFLTVPAALDFLAAVGPVERVHRLRFLRDRWVGAVRGLTQLEILTPDDEGMAGGMTSIRVKGKTSKEENVALVDALLERHGIFTVWRTGVAAGDCVRITPGPTTSADDVDRLAAALREIVPA